MAKVSEHALLASICKSSYYDFFLEFWPQVCQEPLVENWHLKFLCDEYQHVMERVFKRLPKEQDHVTNIAPGSSKSTVASVMLAPWAWTRMPECQFVCASFTFPLATFLGSKSRDLVRTEKYQALFPPVRIRDDADSKHFFQNTRGGWRYSVGIGGSVFGLHGHVLVVDDPLDPKKAASDADLKAANDWLRDELPSRKVDKDNTPTLLIMQRLRQGDCSDLMTAWPNVRHVRLPAEVNEQNAAHVQPPELLSHYRDGLFDPVRLNRRVLAEYRDKPDGWRAYPGQFLQDPKPPGGGLFHTGKFRLEPHPPRAFRMVARGWDKAGLAPGRGGDWTCGVKMGVDLDGRFWVLDVIRIQADSSVRERLIKDTAAKDGRACTIILEQEPGSGGLESAQNSVRNLRGYRVKVFKPGRGTGDKAERADPYACQVNVGNVTLVKATWNDHYKAELDYFPGGKHDDCVDASSLCANYLAKGRIRIGAVRERRS